MAGISYVASNGSSGGAVSSLTYAINSTGTTNGFLAVIVVLVDTGGQTISGVTFNGVAMTERYQYAPGTVANRRIGAYYLVNPAAGNYNVVVTLSGAVSHGVISSGGVWKEAAQSGNPEAYDKLDQAADTSITKGVTTLTDTAWLVGLLWVNGSGVTITPQGGATQRNYTDNSANTCAGVIDSTSGKTPAGAYTLATNLSASQVSTLIVLSVAPKDLPSKGGGIRGYFEV